VAPDRDDATETDGEPDALGIALPEEESAASAEAVARAFGAENRQRLIDRYFASHGPPEPGDVSRHVYGLLLSIDRTTGLAHCYESDKSQPGRNWYDRSLRFHEWASEHLGATPGDLVNHIDILFKAAVAQLAAYKAERMRALSAKAEGQRRPFAGRGFPEPGVDPELDEIVLTTLGPWISSDPSPEAMKTLTERVHAYLGQENKRANLVGEGFEDVLATLVRTRPLRSPSIIGTRMLLHDVGGFNRPRGAEKAKKVDLVIVQGEDRHRTLVTAKWSVRADREEQFGNDYGAYARLEAAGEKFDYILVTNEFDAARLVAACDNRVGNQRLFDVVIHVNVEAVLATYGPELRTSAARLPELIDARRLVSLGEWLKELPQAGA
jgi:hypothetical protein